MVYGKAVCNTTTASWSSARNQCQSDGQQLLSSDNNKCLANGDQYWHGRYSEETIFWKSGIHFHYYTIYSYVLLTDTNRCPPEEGCVPECWSPRKNTSKVDNY